MSEQSKDGWQEEKRTLLAAIDQSTTELEEAGNVCEGLGLPGLASLFRAAVKRNRHRSRSQRSR